jgi:hypothetical protein
VDILEKEIEEKLKVSLESLGCMVFKFVSPGRAGVPDRLILLPGGSCFFVELKRPGQKLRPLQQFWKDKLMAQGACYYLVDSFEAVDEVVMDAKAIRWVQPDGIHTP